MDSDPADDWLRVLGQILDDFTDVYRSPRPTERGLELYIDALADLTVAELVAAARNLIRDHPRFYPTPAEIRAAVPQFEPLYLAAPEHRPLPNVPRRAPPSPEAIAEVTASCAAIRRILAGGTA